MSKARILAIVALLIAVAAQGFSSQTVIPTTTLSAERGNNTSTPDSFQAQTNGNSGAGNVSKVDIRELLYPGSKTTVYAHYMPWFGTSSHMDVGYSTADPKQVARQVDDMISRGIHGVIIDWYGPGSAHADQSTALMMAEAEKHTDFKFAIMADAGALRNVTDKTQGLITALTYAWQKYEQSPNYMRSGDRPVVFFFGVEALAIDWTVVKAQVPGKPIFVLQNSSSFAKGFADGGFSWVGSFGNPDDWGQKYLADFYKTGKTSNKAIVGSVKKGFNDTLAAWGSNRIISQNCGQTWLNTFSEISKHFNSTQQLENLQLVTWNDYEEGTALEMGIDNCVTVRGSVSGDTLNWTVSGNESTVHHYEVFISADGQSMMKLADVAAGIHELNVGNFGFQKGAYSLYVKAIGKPSIRNKVSDAIAFSAVDPLPADKPDLTLKATPSILVVSRGGSATTDVVLTPGGDFNAAVQLSCVNLPKGVSCAFDQEVMTPRTSPITAKLTLKAIGTRTTAGLFGGYGLLALCLPGFGMILVADRKRSRKLWSAVLIATLALVMISTGCLGLAKPPTQTSSTSARPQVQTSAPGTYTFTILAKSGTVQRSVPATLTIN